EDVARDLSSVDMAAAMGCGRRWVGAPGAGATAGAPTATATGTRAGARVGRGRAAASAALGVRRRDVADLTHLGVARVARAGREADVAVGEDVRQPDGGAVRVLGVRGALGVVGVRALGVDPRDREAPPDDLADLADGRVGRGDGGVVAHHRDAPGVAVEAAGVGALDVAAEPAVATLE